MSGIWSSLGVGVRGSSFRVSGQGFGFRVWVWVLGFRIPGSWFRVPGSWFMIQGPGFRVHGPGFRVQGSGFRVQGSGFGVQGSILASWFRVQGACLRLFLARPRCEQPPFVYEYSNTLGDTRLWVGHRLEHLLSS